MKLIILAAGDAFELDGYNKLLIRHPIEGKTILELYAEYFDVENIEIVVGYNAIEIMNAYPKFQYIYNKKWQITSSSYSLYLGLNGEPCYVVPSDYILDKETVELMSCHENCALIKHTENRRITSLNARVSAEGIIEQIYGGKSKNNDPELLGVFKISDKSIIRKWKKGCILHSQNYAGENLPLNTETPIKAIIASDEIYEINTPEDYIQFLNKIN